MSKKCENCGKNEVEEDRDVCQECIDEVLKKSGLKK